MVLLSPATRHVRPRPLVHTARRDAVSFSIATITAAAADYSSCRLFRRLDRDIDPYRRLATTFCGTPPSPPPPLRRLAPSPLIGLDFILLPPSLPPVRLPYALSSLTVRPLRAPAAEASLARVLA